MKRGNVVTSNKRRDRSCRVYNSMAAGGNHAASFFLFPFFLSPKARKRKCVTSRLRDILGDKAGKNRIQSM